LALANKDVGIFSQTFEELNNGTRQNGLFMHFCFFLVEIRISQNEHFLLRLLNGRKLPFRFF